MNQEFGNIIDLDGNTIINLGNPVNGGDAVNKNYVYGNFSSVESREPFNFDCTTTSTAPVLLKSLSYPPTSNNIIDGVTREIELYFLILKGSTGSNSFRINFLCGTFNLTHAVFSSGNPNFVNQPMSVKLIQNIRSGDSQNLFLQIRRYNTNGVGLINDIIVQAEEGTTGASWNKLITNNINISFESVTFATQMNFKCNQFTDKLF